MNQELLEEDLEECFGFILLAQDELSKIYDLFSYYEKLDNSIDSYHQEFKKDIAHKSNVITYLQSNSETLNNTVSVISQKFSSIEEMNTHISSEISSLKIFIKEFSSKIEFHDDFIRKVRGEIDSSSEKSDNYFIHLKSEIRDVRSDLQNFISKTASDFNSMKNLIESNRRDISDAKMNVSVLSSSLDSHSKKTNSNFSELKNSFQSNYLGLTDKIDKLEEKTQDFIDTSIKDKDKVDPLSQIYVSMDEMKRIFESSKLDIQNANLRSSNTSAQIQLLEKKIENILLTIRKIELDK